MLPVLRNGLWPVRVVEVSADLTHLQHRHNTEKKYEHKVIAERVVQRNTPLCHPFTPNGLPASMNKRTARYNWNCTTYSDVK